MVNVNSNNPRRFTSGESFEPTFRINISGIEDLDSEYLRIDAEIIDDGYEIDKDIIITYVGSYERLPCKIHLPNSPNRGDNARPAFEVHRGPENECEVRDYTVKITVYEGDNEEELGDCFQELTG